jgi:hypothetical protein
MMDEIQKAKKSKLELSPFQKAAGCPGTQEFQMGARHRDRLAD